MKKTLALILLFLLTSSTAFGAIARDTQLDCGQDAASPHTCTVTLGATATLIIADTFNQNADGNNNITGCTYGGVTMTKMFTLSIQNGGLGAYNNIFYLLNPPTGANTLSCSHGGAGNGTWMAAQSFSGVGSFTASSSNSASSVTSISASVTTTVDNSWLMGQCSGQTSGPLTAGSNTSVSINAGPGQYSLIDTNAAQTPTGSKSMACTGSSQNMAILVAAFAPTVAASTAAVNDDSAWWFAAQ